MTTTGLDTSNGLGLRVFVGAHSDRLWDKVDQDRPPWVAFSAPLEEGVNTVNNPYGGLIYLQVDHDELRPGTADVVIDGAVRAPRFELGVDTNADFGQILVDGEAPWGDVVGGAMISTLPRGQMLLMTDPEETAQAWSDIVTHQYDLMGLDGSGPLDTPPAGMHHFVVDEQISAGWMHSGYPIMAYTSADLYLTSEVLSWGPYHELGHNFQQGEWRIVDSGEVSNNLFSLFCQEKFGQGSRLADQGNYASTDADLAAGLTYVDLDVFDKLTFYRRLSLAYGWDFYRDLFRATRLRHDSTGSGLAAGETPEDFLVVEGSILAGEDLRPFFAHYGIGISAAADSAVGAMGLPLPSPPIETLVE